MAVNAEPGYTGKFTPTPLARHGACPSCGQNVDFQYVGQQNWPLSLARKRGINPVTQLYCCPQCESSFSEESISS